MPSEPVLVALIAGIASLITGFLTWIFGRRRSEAEISEISTRVFTVLVTELEERVDRQSKIIQEQEESYRKIKIYVEKLEELLITGKIIKRQNLREIKNNLGLY